MSNEIRNRIRDHRRVRCGDLVPHELNPRVHSDAQRQALAGLYAEIGFARSLLAYELPDGRLKLIDGHLRAAMDPDHEVDVEILDVNDAEARALLLAIDPLAQLAGYEKETLEELRELVEKDSAAIQHLWKVLEEAANQTRRAVDDAGEIPEQFLIVIECADEAEQVRLLEQFEQEGIRCQAKVS